MHVHLRCSGNFLVGINAETLINITNVHLQVMTLDPVLGHSDYSEMNMDAIKTRNESGTRCDPIIMDDNGVK